MEAAFIKPSTLEKDRNQIVGNHDCKRECGMNLTLHSLTYCQTEVETCGQALSLCNVQFSTNS